VGSFCDTGQSRGKASRPTAGFRGHPVKTGTLSSKRDRKRPTDRSDNSSKLIFNNYFYWHAPCFIVFNRKLRRQQMDNSTNLLAALRRVRSFPSYSSFMAGHERQRIKRELQKRLLRLRRQRQVQQHPNFVTKQQQIASGIFQHIFH
jgi:hypothetical protein